MPGKKWCEYCRINLPYDKSAIQQHQSSKNHVRNKQNHIKFERLKVIKDQKAVRQQKQPAFTSTANIPKAKKGSQLEKQVAQYKNDVISNGKMAIHQLIAEKTKGLFGAPIEYPDKKDLIIAENYIDQDKIDGQQEEGQGPDKYQMWKIDICEQTGNPCFINKITKMILYEPPKGYILSEEQKEQWEDIKRICEQNPEGGQEEAGEVGQWEEVASEQDYFNQNQASEDEQQQQQQQIRVPPPPPPINAENLPIKQQYLKKQEYIIKKEEYRTKQEQKNWLDTLHGQVNRNEVSESQVFNTMVDNTLSECRNIKQKNETLKKLIKHDIDIHKTLDKQLMQEYNYQDEDQGGQKQSNVNQKVNIGLKPRKKVKTVQLTNQRDIL